MVVDPVSSFWGDKKENSNQEVREALQPLQQIAEKTGVTFLLVQHLAKGLKMTPAIDTVIGSTAITAYARTAWKIFRDKADANIRHIVHLKGNSCIKPKGISFTIVENGKVEILDAELEKEADEFHQEELESYGAIKPSGGRKADKRTEAEKWLEDFLTTPKPVGVENDPEPGTVYYEGREAGHSAHTLRRAAEVLGVKKTYNKDFRKYYWSLSLEAEETLEEELPPQSSLEEVFAVEEKPSVISEQDVQGVSLTQEPTGDMAQVLSRSPFVPPEKRPLGPPQKKESYRERRARIEEERRQQEAASVQRDLFDQEMSPKEEEKR